MGRITNTRRAAAENALARFLVDWCQEGPGLEIRGTDLHEVFGIWWRVQNRKSHTVKQVHENVYLDIQQMYRLLEEAQIQKETRQELGPRGRPKAVVWWVGLGVDQAKYQAGRELVEPAVQKSAEIKPPLAATESPAANKPAAALEHITIRGVVYARSLVAVVQRLTRQFKHYNTQETMAYVVSFSVVGIPRVYVTEAEGKRLLRDLGQG